jgi:type IV pilus assembly protein PilY1
VLKWKIAGGSGDFAKLAQTWSMPKSVTFASKTGAPPVLLFMGGGYDPAEDQNNSTGTGNAIYVIDGRTGAKIAEFATDYSVPSDVTIADVNGDGVPDRAYVADVRGNLYRIDIPSTGDLLSSATWGSTTAVKIAALGGKVFFAPDVVPTSRFVAVMVGTGDREKPLMVSSADNFFMVKDTVGAPGAVIGKGDMTRIAKIDNATMKPTNLAEPGPDAKGCYIELATNGEKAVNQPFTIAGTTYFGTNRPKPANVTSCSADLGEAYSYKFPLFCGAPAAPVKLVGGGLPPSPVGGLVEMTVNGQVVKVPFVIGAGEGGSPFRPSQPVPPISPVRSRLNWHINNTNR